MPESPDVNALKRRGRRRLVGAIALVLIAVIVLPMVFDSEPKAPAPPVSVRIPGEDDSSFSPKVTPRGEPVAKTPAKQDSPKVAPALPKPPIEITPKQPETRTGEKPIAAKLSTEMSPPKVRDEPAAIRPPVTQQPERQRAETALIESEEFFVQVAALATSEKVKNLTEKLAAAKLPYYTERIATVNGLVTRVRAGPFPTEAEAQKVHAKLLGLGEKPGPVTSKAR